MTTYVDLRPHEKQVITRFLAGNHGFMHVCGMPGTGKTMLVRHLLNVGTVGTVGTYINCSSHDANSLAEELLAAGFDFDNDVKHSRKKRVVVVLDELTSLRLDRPEEARLLNRIVEATYRESWSVVAISNTLDQSWKKVLCTGQLTEPDLPFQPYTTEQLVHLIDTNYPDRFQPAAAKYIAAQVVANAFGDARALVDLCRITLSSTPAGTVAFPTARQVVSEVFRSPTADIIRALSVEFKIVLALCVHLTRVRASGFRQSDLVPAVNTFRMRHRFPVITLNNVKEKLELLQCTSLVSTTTRTKNPKVSTTVTLKDLEDGINTDERLLFKEIIDYADTTS
jgi:Cdc6-like AAA superfamily ATPase